MAATPKRYPLSTPDGQFIPLEVVKPLSLIPLTFTATAFKTIALDAVQADQILILHSTVDCYVSLIPAPVAPVVDTVSPGLMFLPALTKTTIVSNSTSLSVLGVSVSGTCYVNINQTWEALISEEQLVRR